MDSKKHKLSKAFQLRDAQVATSGYQKVDDTTILLRRFFPGRDPDFRAALVSIYDFTNYQLHTYVENRGYGDQAFGTALQVTPFSQVDNTEAIETAHEVLRELEGNPPPLAEVLQKIGKSMKMDKGPLLRKPD